MKKSIFFIIFLCIFTVLQAQNATDKFVLSEEIGVMFGAYGEVHFNNTILYNNDTNYSFSNTGPIVNAYFNYCFILIIKYISTFWINCQYTI